MTLSTTFFQQNLSRKFPKVKTNKRNNAYRINCLNVLCFSVLKKVLNKNYLKENFCYRVFIFYFLSYWCTFEFLSCSLIVHIF